MEVSLHKLLHWRFEMRHTEGQRQEEVHEYEDDWLQVGHKHEVGVVSKNKDLENVFDTVIKSLL